MFHMRQTEAAQALGIAASTLKHVCRRLGIGRWPWRSLVSNQFPCTGGSLAAGGLTPGTSKSDNLGGRVLDGRNRQSTPHAVGGDPSPAWGVIEEDGAAKEEMPPSADVSARARGNPVLLQGCGMRSRMHASVLHSVRNVLPEHDGCISEDQDVDAAFVVDQGDLLPWDKTGINGKGVRAAVSGPDMVPWRKLDPSRRALMDEALRCV
jgi:hypothetical protein